MGMGADGWQWSQRDGPYVDGDCPWTIRNRQPVVDSPSDGLGTDPDPAVFRIGDQEVCLKSCDEYRLTPVVDLKMAGRVSPRLSFDGDVGEFSANTAPGGKLVIDLAGYRLTVDAAAHLHIARREA